jgi:hypothetical protein
MEKDRLSRSRVGSVLNRFALVVIAVVGIGVVAPITSSAATAYFSTVKTVKLVVSNQYNWWNDAGKAVPVTVWCPLGYKVLSGGFDINFPGVTVGDANPTVSKPVTNSTGRQGWQFQSDMRPWIAETATAAIFYAQCIR